MSIAPIDLSSSLPHSTATSAGRTTGPMHPLTSTDTIGWTARGGSPSNLPPPRSDRPDVPLLPLVALALEPCSHVWVPRAERGDPITVGDQQVNFSSISWGTISGVPLKGAEILDDIFEGHLDAFITDWRREGESGWLLPYLGEILPPSLLVAPLLLVSVLARALRAVRGCGRCLLPIFVRVLPVTPSTAREDPKAKTAGQSPSPPPSRRRRAERAVAP